MRKYQVFFLTLAAALLVGLIAACSVLPQAEIGGDNSALNRAATLTTLAASSQTWTATNGHVDTSSSTAARLYDDLNAAGSTFQFTGSVPAGTYSVTVNYMKRNIYGIYSLKINGAQVGSTFDAYVSSSSDTAASVTLGTVTLSAATSTFLFTTTGKNASATDWDVKIKNIVMTPSGATTAPTATPAATATPSPTAVPTATPVGATPTPTKTPSPTPVAATPTPVASTPTPTPASSGNITITGSGGWFETAWATWNAVSGASGYSVSYKTSSASTYTAADAALVRGTRVDIPGLLGNTTYNVKIDAVGASASSTVTVTTLAYDRSGFAFLPSSPNGSTTGGYQVNGTPASGATILYVSESTKNSVQMAVTKGSTTTTYTGIANIMKARESAKTTVPLIVRIIGTVTPPTGDAYGSGLLNIKGHFNTTFEGVGTNALLNGWGLNIRAMTNVEVRNLSFYMFPDDSVSIQTDNRNIWVHNNDFQIGADGGGDKALGDGSCDIKANSSYITVSYNHFIGTGKSSLIGLSESAEFFVTLHHNYFDGSHSRHPRVRTGTIHVYNNYFKGITVYGVGAAEKSSIFVQNNYFENSYRPMIIASQGHDLDSSGESTLSGENGGSIKASGNYMDATTLTSFDAANDTGNAKVGGGTYNNFDSNFSSNGYPLSLDAAAAGQTKTVQYAGRLK